MTKNAGEYAYITSFNGMGGQPKTKNQENIRKQTWRDDVEFETRSSKSLRNHIFREEWQKLPVLGLISLSADRDEAIAAGAAESQRNSSEIT